ncbi:MAG: DNA-3-methyladenine glycosylase [Candidatus Yanofskybacteria bacterium]|nr:DNA-3-methyladenine glycosylase [Candidatus Yanofskybacteria bacterium]
MSRLTTNSSKRLGTTFFNRSTLTVAQELLGKFLVRRIRRKTISVMITETEAYCGPSDLASHASRGRTKRTEVMFGPPGHAYIYLIYGMYHCFNIVTEKEDYPAAVLIRAIDAEGVNGPGKLCRYFQINRSLNNEDLTASKKLWLEDRKVKVKPSQIKCFPRIGIDYAGSYKNKLWRFVLSP